LKQKRARGSGRGTPRSILDRCWRYIAFAVLVAFASNYVVYYLTYTGSGDTAIARSAALTTIVLFELLLAYQVRPDRMHLLSRAIGKPLIPVTQSYA